MWNSRDLGIAELIIGMASGGWALVEDGHRSGIVIGAMKSFCLLAMTQHESRLSRGMAERWRWIEQRVYQRIWISQIVEMTHRRDRGKVCVQVILGRDRRVWRLHFVFIKMGLRAAYRSSLYKRFTYLCAVLFFSPAPFLSLSQTIAKHEKEISS